MKGKLIIFSAPSGAGKTTIVHHLLKTFPDKIAFSISATTRPSRGDERHKIDYYFITKEEFLHKVAKHEFVEFEEVYSGTFYGTLNSEIQRIWDQGKTVIFDLDVEGGLRLKKKYGKNALAIFVQPPSLAVLVDRLKNRGTETEQKVTERINKAEKELTYASKFDVILKNNELDLACKEAEDLLLNFMR
ncbi:guanylate kinase [Pedobacter psychrophilus]|uniref:Guanylate kinase n=1 Tax=Pedobacter psychrophilus TaxID=1826909 RepID=A0A179DDZ2_9SPHI|nr:guanylate kinase [Pedobacter psychrophilus]OAQ39265.1 guanylate kinase [Pedobacter psychrophilus]